MNGPTGSGDRQGDPAEPVFSDNSTGSEIWDRLRWVRRLLPLAFLVLVGLLSFRELRRLDFHAVRAVLGSLSTWHLLVIQAVSAAGILAMSFYDWRAARAFRIRLPARVLVRNAWIANAFNNLIGLSGLTGSAIRMLLLGSERVDTKSAAAYSTLVMLSVPVGLSVLCWLGLLPGGPAIGDLPVPAWSAWLALAAFAAYSPLYAVCLHKGLLSRWIPELSAQPAGPIFWMILVSTLDWLLAAAAAWVALDFTGAQLPMLQFLSVFVLAAALGIFSLIPGGLGVFDATLVVLLAPVARGAEHLVSGVLIYRLCYFLVPWLVAVYLGADRLALRGHWEQAPVFRQIRDSRLFGLLGPPLRAAGSLGVRVLAYLTFGGGLVLLASAAFPALADRLTALNRYLPGAAIEISHQLAIVAGVLLLALSRGIAGQVRSAYRLTQCLLIGGAIFSLLKGIDYEEATLLVGVALLLRQQRSRFYRDSYPLFSLRNLAWLAALVLALAAFAWLGAWVHGEVPLGWDYLSRFEPAQEAPRFARGLLVAAFVAIVYVGWSFFRRPLTRIEPPGQLELDEAEAVLERYGGSEFAHLVFLGDKFLFWSPTRDAFIQYGKIRDRLISLGDPCGNPEAFDAMILAFREYADRHDLTPCFYEASETHLHFYHDAGMALFKLGETALVDVATFTTAGKRGESLRHSANRAQRDGTTFEMLSQPVDEQIWPQLRAVSDAWLADRGAAEKGFSLGSYNETYLRRGPIAVIRVEERIVAFATLLPDYGSHSQISIDLMRHRSDAPKGTMDFLFVELIRHAREQGYRYFNLGMAPLGGVGETRYARTGEKVARLAFEYGNRFYNYKGLRSFKEKFHPQWRSVYLAYPVLTPLPLLLMDSAALIAGGYRRIFLKSD